MTVDQAMHLLHMHKHQVHRIGKPPGRWTREPDIEQVRAEILRRIEAWERHDPQRLARNRAAWARRRPPDGAARARTGDQTIAIIGPQA